MIQTIKDAEIQIEALKRQIVFLEREIRKFPVNGSASISKEKETVVIKEISEVDSIVSANSGSIQHKLYHIFADAEFKSLFTKNLNAENLDVTEDLNVGDTIITKFLKVIGGGAVSQFHISEDLTDNGFYIINLKDFKYSAISQGAMHNGTSWIAKDTEAAIITITSTGFKFLHNTGLTVNTNFTPTVRFEINTSGNIIMYGNLTVNGLINTSQYYAAGSAGISQAYPLPTISGVTVNTGTLNYKDHAGTNQTAIVVTSVNPTVRNEQYHAGIKVA